MSDHSDALTLEQKEFVERAHQFQKWADDNGFGRLVYVEDEIRRQYEEGEYGEDWDSDQISMIGTLLVEIDRLRKEPDVNEPLDPKSIHSHVRMLRIIIEENGETYTPEGMMVFLRVLLKDFENLLNL